MNKYVASEYESGWYVERADEKDIERTVQVAGPYQTASDAEAMIRVLDKADARRRGEKRA